MIKRMVAFVLFFQMAQVANSTAYYCDPVNGNNENTGLTLSSAWPALETVISKKAFSPGDTIYLLSGNHGAPIVTRKNSEDVVITKFPGENPVLKQLVFSGASHWKIDGLTISSEGARIPLDPPLEHPVYPLKENSLVQIVSNSSAITMVDCYIASVGNSSEWTKDDWNYKAWNGIYNRQNSNVTIRNCHLKNINFGIDNSESCSDNLYEYNVIENFCGDGLRAHGTNTVIQYNTVKNSYDTNGNHDDLVQAFQSGQVGLVLRGNILMAYTDQNQPFKSVCQGIGFFDGIFHDFVIENNIVATNHWHGITLLGAENCKIINNTVVDLDNTDSPVPWIMIDDHKNGTASSGCIIRNNICTDIRTGAGVTTDHNQIISFPEYNRYFIDFAHLDLHLKSGAPAIDKGSPEQAPNMDMEKTVRPQGEGFDIGAYEYHESATGLRIPEFNPDFAPKFYPNPTSGKLNFELPGSFTGSITISDCTGKKVLEKRILSRQKAVSIYPEVTAAFISFASMSELIPCTK